MHTAATPTSISDCPNINKMKDGVAKYYGGKIKKFLKKERTGSKLVLKCFGPSGKRNGTKRILIENGQRIAACRSTFSLSNQTPINRITNKKVKISLRQSLLLAWFWVKRHTIKDTATMWEIRRD